jgi:hypothetical protein
MKNLTTLFVLRLIPFFILIASTNLSAQSNWEAGVRFGDNFSIDATIPIGATPRLHPAVYFDRFGVGTYFDWMFALSDGPTGLKFYPGVGPEFFFEDRFDFAVAGNFGAEFSFKFPLTVGFDWRPGFRLTNGSKWKSDNWGITARYRFNKGAKLVPAN